jgi:hypothetical protein
MRPQSLMFLFAEPEHEIRRKAPLIPTMLTAGRMRAAEPAQIRSGGRLSFFSRNDLSS